MKFLRHNPHITNPNFVPFRSNYTNLLYLNTMYWHLILFYTGCHKNLLILNNNRGIQIFFYKFVSQKKTTLLLPRTFNFLKNTLYLLFNNKKINLYRNATHFFPSRLNQLLFNNLRTPCNRLNYTICPEKVLLYCQNFSTSTRTIAISEQIV